MLSNEVTNVFSHLCQVAQNNPTMSLKVLDPKVAPSINPYQDVCVWLYIVVCFLYCGVLSQLLWKSNGKSSESMTGGQIIVEV